MGKKIDRGPRKYMIAITTDTGFRLWGTNVMYSQSAQIKYKRILDYMPEAKIDVRIVELVDVTPKEVSNDKN
jgi:hypothetical protein